jgi:integrase
MGLELRPTSRYWYGRFMVRGKWRVVNLGVKVRGVRPDSPSKPGDPDFERSRGRAEEAFKEAQAKVDDERSAENLVRRLYTIRTGEKIRAIPVPHLAKEWKARPRTRSPDPRYASQCVATLTRFVEFIQKDHPEIKELADVSRMVAGHFMEKETARGVTAKTWNDTLKLLRSTFKHLQADAGMPANPFDHIPVRQAETIFRKPFTPEELAAIVAAADQDPFIKPVIVTAICTAMRRGDCCTLRWGDVDLKHDFVTVKTAKTGQTVSIPILRMFRDELAALPRDGEFVFPRQARLYQTNPDAITDRVRQVLKAAGFAELPKPDESTDPGAGGSAKSLPAPAPPPSGQAPSPPTKTIQAVRTGGKRNASLYDFHSFRVTWVTLALTAGIPLEIVQKVTGHKTAEIVMTHYFQPGREQFRKLIESKMPALLSNGAKTPLEQAVEILGGATSKTWRKCIDQALALLKEPAA